MRNVDGLTLILWSNSYPYDICHEQNFLDDEVTALAAEFDRIILVPWMVGGARSNVPNNVEVDESYAAEARARGRRQIVVDAIRPLLLDEVARRPTASARSPKRLAVHAGSAEHARDWTLRLCGRGGMDPARCVFYTYWWTHATLGFGLAKRALAGASVVTRAHGYDLYEERHSPPYIPFRSQSLRMLDALFPISDAGASYVAERYRTRPGILETARLGVKDPGGTSVASEDGVLRIVSCSFMVAVKRLDRLIDGLGWAARARPRQRIEWTHFGEGPLLDEINQQARTLPGNVRWRIAPYSTRHELFRAYCGSPIDVFVNVSASEGIPVTIMEAISCGIPVVATAVGGNPEIVGRDNGILIAPDPSPEELASAIFRLLDEPARAQACRQGSRLVWRERYDADRNFRSFAARLRSLPG